MKYLNTGIDGLYVVEQDVSKDNRGSFVKNFNKDEFNANNLECDFKESYYTKSKEDVIRGMHFQTPPHDHAKLITVISGTILDVVLDIRKNSKTFGESFSIELSRENKKSLFIPRGLAHGFGVLSDIAIAYYNVTSVYNPSHDEGILYDSFNYEWPIQNPIISDRDLKFVEFNKFNSKFN